ncbi:hypothetical protein RRG08_002093 [Elysia crispata]|uniref:Uncharacterized protein n=1 Tax=Elysia crispata TaxID=231223 RepID=A0AAE1DII1_9GAST|nr:hypothetical protein RRG08_002093 [Elysia crispata]
MDKSSWSGASTEDLFSELLNWPRSCGVRVLRIEHIRSSQWNPNNTVCTKPLRSSGILPRNTPVLHPCSSDYGTLASHDLTCLPTTSEDVLSLEMHHLRRKHAHMAFFRNDGFWFWEISNSFFKVSAEFSLCYYSSIGNAPIDAYI